MRILASIIVIGLGFAGLAAIHADSPADFDSDSDVDGADFLAWQRGLGSTDAAATRANGNADNDADVDADDLAAWAASFAAPRTPSGQYLGMDSDELGKIRSQIPDGQLDHHIKLAGLNPARRITFIDIKAGSDADITDDWKKWSTDAGEESPAHPAGLWWWIKQTPRIANGPTATLDLLFSKAAPNQAFTEYRVYVYYSSTDLTDRDFIRVSVPASPPAAAASATAPSSNRGQYRPPRRGQFAP
jgi:hypothetical protein